MQVSNNPYMIAFGACQIVLSQIRNLNELWLVSMTVTMATFGYAAIGIGLAIAKTTGRGSQSHKTDRHQVPEDAQHHPCRQVLHHSG